MNKARVDEIKSEMRKAVAAMQRIGTLAESTSSISLTAITQANGTRFEVGSTDQDLYDTFEEVITGLGGVRETQI